jgi:hypothetical protein
MDDAARKSARRVAANGRRSAAHLETEARNVAKRIAHHGPDWYSDRDDDLQTMLRDALADIRHAYDLLQIEDPQLGRDHAATRQREPKPAMGRGSLSRIWLEAMTTRTPPPRLSLSLSDIRSELEHLPSDELRALSRAIARVLEEREKPRRML